MTTFPLSPPQGDVPSVHAVSAAHTDAEVIIVGAGPVGLMLAICLSEQGVVVRIFDALEEPIEQWKACVLHSRTQEMLSRHGLFEACGDVSGSTSGMNFVAEGRIYRLNLGAANTARPGMLLIQQHQTERILTETLEKRFGVTIERGWTLTDISLGDSVNGEASLSNEGLAIERASASTSTSEGISTANKNVSEDVQTERVVGPDGKTTIVVTTTTTTTTTSKKNSSQVSTSDDVSITAPLSPISPAGGAGRSLSSDFASAGVPIQSTWKNKDGRSISMSSTYVVGCDGAHSQTRKLLQLPFHGEALPTLMAVADVVLETDLPQPQEPHTFTHPHGMVGCFPLPTPNTARIIMALPLPTDNGVSTEDPAHAVFLQAATNSTLGTELVEDCGPAPQEQTPLLSRPIGRISRDNFAEELQRRMAPFKLQSCHLQDVRPFRVNERRAESFHDASARVFLCGDSAHVHSPVGGQGLNIGLQDAENLGWKMAAVLRGQSPHSILQTYGQERAPIADHAIGLSGKLLRVLSFRGWVPRLIRRIFFWALVSIKGFNAVIASKISQVATQYPAGTLSQVASPRRNPKAWPTVGQRAPEARVWVMPGMRQSYILSELPAQWHIVAFTPARGRWPDYLREMMERTGGYRVTPSYVIVAPTDVSREGGCQGARVLLDLKDDQARLAWGITEVGEGVAFLIRPDGIIAGASPIEGAAKVFGGVLDEVLLRV